MTADPQQQTTATIALNAHLLSAQAGYRRAGIHHYIYNTLVHLPDADPSLRYRILVGEGTPPDHPHFAVRRSPLRTDHPIRRIVWEQAVQPFALGGTDLVHEMAFVAPVIMPKPFVVTVYDLTFMRYPERLPRSRRLYLRMFTRLACARARRIIAISHSTADDLVSLLSVPRDRIDLAIPGVDPRYHPLPAEQVSAWREHMGLPERYLLHVGTLEPRKNLPVLLRALAALPPADRIPLVLVGGKGWMTDEIEQIIAEHDLASLVHRPGFVADEDLPLWYNAADAFVYPSVFEGWGMPVVEAMACGIPVLVSNVSSLPEAASDVGMQLPPNDVSAWTDALHRVIRDAAWRAEQGQHARARAKGFTWARTAEQTVASYRAALHAASHG
jgi:glycosyltransferase involved in cell wall biosynthesis